MSLRSGPGIHSLAIPAQLRHRFNLREADITMYNLATPPERLDASTLTPCPIEPCSFDLVIADGHQYPEMQQHDPRSVWSKERLLLSQLLVALRAIKPGGTLLAKLSRQTSQISILLMRHTIVALSRLSSTPVQAIKPESIYADKPTFYILVQGVDSNKCIELAQTLEEFWYFMTFEGVGGFGRGPKPEDFDAIATRSDVSAKNQYLKELLDPIEKIQKAAAAVQKTNQSRR